MRRLVSEVMVSQKPIADNQLDVIYETFLKEKALLAGSLPAIPKLSDSSALLDPGSSLVLVRLSELKNVNALVADQSIEFNPRLTIVFGENACGKTGYVRVLKKAAAVRTTEAVLPDVSLTQSGKALPSARIAYRLGQQPEQELEWKDQTGLSPFNRIDVFDSRATALHVDGDLNYLYTPGELARFPLVQQGIDAVRNRLEKDIAARAPAANPFLAHFNRQSRLYPQIDSLGASTDLAQLRALAAVSDTETQQVPTLRVEIDALQTTNPGPQLKLAEATKQNLDALTKAFLTIGRFDLPLYMKSLERLHDAERRYEKATRESFAGVPVPGVLKEEWRRFIQAGEEYLKTLEGLDTYPRQSDVCLYCRQPLSSEAEALLRKYRDYCNNDLRADLNGAVREIEAIRRTLSQAIDFADVERRCAELAENGASASRERHSEVLDFVTKGKTLRDAVQEGKPFEWTEQASKLTSVLKYVEEAQTHNIALIQDLTERRDKREQALGERREKLLDVESRLKLTELMPQIEAVVRDAKWVDMARIQQRKFPALLRSLTDNSKIASEQLLNRDFERHFTEECNALGAPAVVLQFPGRQGQVTRKKAVARGEYRPSDVLSEGEQKVIALADFLAEASLKPPAPVVFDDPINSLDYRRMAEVVGRIVVLSESRQVIVFTHNIWFTTELLARFEKKPKDCSYYDVSRDGSRIGIVSKGTHPRSDTVSNLRGRINVIIQSAERLSGEPQAALIEKGYELMRNICEVIVEKELLQGVAQRYQPNIMMTQLSNINFGGLEAAVSVIYPIYEDCCRYVASHSQPLESLNVRPTLETLQADWKMIQDMRDGYVKNPKKS